MMSNHPSRMIVGPFNRVEGDLEVKLSIEEQKVREARVNSPLFRGFERLLLNRPASDVLVYAPRICGICSVSQSVASAYALADVYQMQMANQGRILSNLILATENLADHLTSFYLFFMPDFTRPIYADYPWYDQVKQHFQAGSSALAQVMQIRATWLNIMGIVAGKWPHSLAIRAGGTTRAVALHEVLQLRTIVAQVQQFVSQRLIGDDLQTFLSLSSQDELMAWATSADAQAHLPLFLQIAQSLNLSELGVSQASLMSYGSYLKSDQDRYFTSGTYQHGQLGEVDVNRITEDVSHARYRLTEPCTPWQSSLDPAADRYNAYSWCKAPRLNGQVIEVGALARQVIDGHPLLRDLYQHSASNVMTRVFARVFEIARVLALVDAWLDELVVGEPSCYPDTPKDGRGVGLVEAARGSLGHWLAVEKGKIKQFQVIAPTTWNFSPRDQQGIAGALEQALVGTPCLDGEIDPVSVQHIVRSFDPCMSCTVH